MQNKRRALLLIAASMFFSTFPAIATDVSKSSDSADHQLIAQAAGFTWNEDWDKSLEEAQKANKLVLVDVYTDWCGWCKRLDRDTYSDPDVSKYLGEKFVCIKANAEKPKFRKKIAPFNVTGFPAILVLEPSGKLKGRMDGYLPPKEFSQALHSIADR